MACEGLPPVRLRLRSNAAVNTRWFSSMSSLLPTRISTLERVNSSNSISTYSPSVIRVSISSVVSLLLASTRS